jgi:hypothetical protein
VFELFFSFLATTLTLYNFIPYLWSLIQNKNVPHYFSWIIWGSTTIVVSFAQFSDGAGVGSFPIAISGGFTLLVALISFVKRKKVIVRYVDWLFLILALSSIPVWYLSQDATIAILILTIVDLLGFGPSIVKAVYSPNEESPVFFGLFAIRNLFTILALENLSFVTLCFPASIGIACICMVILLLLRQKSQTTV